MQVNDLVPKTSDLDHIFESDSDNDDAVSIVIDEINITWINIQKIFLNAKYLAVWIHFNKYKLIYFIFLCTCH